MNPFVSKVNQTIKKTGLIKSGDRFLLGLSGGPDSVFLFWIFKKLQKKYNFFFEAIHVNYQVRGKDCQKEERLCQKLCKDNQVNLYIYKVPKSKIKKSQNFEQTARKIRYKAFLKTAFNNYQKLDIKKFKNSFKNNYLRRPAKIALAHNLDDQAETVIMNFFRGSGLKGVAGMRFSRKIGNNLEKTTVIRPLLKIPKKEIESFLRKQNIKYCLDRSNLNQKFKRNKIRHLLIPLIEKDFNSNIKRSLLKSSLLFQQAYEIVQKNALKKYKKALVNENLESKEISIDWKILKKEMPLIKSGVVRIIIKKIKGNLKNLNFATLEKLINYLENPQKKGDFKEIKSLIVFKKKSIINFKESKNKQQYK
ncbi:MAG: tRNA lysidine(34) synthetase TilS [Candidatus Moranbacteria bacterium]|nr:tRNA lysidine(34) synthetase TilS [Candidatus Moranbacteria bacterium]